MEFFGFLAVSFTAVWVFFAWNDLAVLSGRLKALKEEIETLQTLKHGAETGTDVALIDERLAKARRGFAASKAHYDRIYTSFTGSRLAAVLGFAADPCAAAAASPRRPAPRAA